MHVQGPRSPRTPAAGPAFPCTHLERRRTTFNPLPGTCPAGQGTAPLGAAGAWGPPCPPQESSLWPLARRGLGEGKRFPAKCVKQMQVNRADGTDDSGSRTPTDGCLQSGHREQNSCFLNHSSCTEHRIRFDGCSARYRNESWVSCLLFQNSPGRTKTSCTITTHSEGKCNEVGFLKCQPAEQATSLPTGHGGNVAGEPTQRSTARDSIALGAEQRQALEQMVLAAAFGKRFVLL